MDWVKSGVDLFETLKTRIDGPYFVVCSVAAALTFEAVRSASQPTDVLVRVAEWVGLNSLADWMQHAPPALTGHDERIFSVAYGVLCLLLVVLVCRPLYLGRHDLGRVLEIAWRQSGSTFTASFWVVAAVAAQSGDMSQSFEGWKVFGRIVVLVVAAALGLGIIASVLTRLLDLDPGRWARGLWRCLGRGLGVPLLSALYALGSLAWVLFYPAIAVGIWAFSFGEDYDGEELGPAPTGAIVR